MELLTITSYCIICVFVLLINKVSLQDVNVVEGVTGGSVVLPCATSEIQLKLSDINVHWRHNDKLTVCAIIEGTFSLQDQDFNFKNRVETFPTEYEKGNFSLKLNNLTHADAGGYWCYILHSSVQVITQLSIKESRMHTVETPTEETPAQKTRSRMALIPAFGVVILSCIFIGRFWK